LPDKDNTGIKLPRKFGRTQALREGTLHEFLF
jgi:hypothetical protein